MVTLVRVRARRYCGQRVHRGFSLVELLLAVAVILIIMAIVTLQMLRGRIAANEASAASSLRTLSSMQWHYQTIYQQGFAPSLVVLGPPTGGDPPSPTAAGLIDSVLASGIKNGYSFVYQPVVPSGTSQATGYTVNANPLSPGQTGNRYFYLDETSVIRWSRSGPADKSSPPLPQ